MCRSSRPPRMCTMCGSRAMTGRRWTSGCFWRSVDSPMSTRTWPGAPRASPRSGLAWLLRTP
ncbi:unnamed protein product [Effrenium voratum]|nr:unnamed protein product [Effrenium voratum]